MKAAYIPVTGTIVAALIAGLFTFFSKNSPTVKQTVSENGKAAIHTGQGDINQ